MKYIYIAIALLVCMNINAAMVSFSVDMNNYMYAQTKSEVNTKLPKDVEKLV